MVTPMPIKKTLNYERGQLVKVVWIDIISESKWMSEEDIDKLAPAECTTIGHFVKDTAEFVVTAATTADDEPTDEEKPEQFGDVICIPKGVIRKIVKL